VRCLVVEDEEAFSEEIVSILEALPGPTEVRLAADRDAAQALIDAEFFDLLILDLRIPTIAGALDENPIHGLAVFTPARRSAPGMPILLLTASSAEDFIPTLLQEAQQIDIWGTRAPLSTIQFLKKRELTKLPDVLSAFATPIAGLANVEVHSPDFALPLPYDRLVRIFASRFGGARCVVKPLGGGLSGAQVLRLVVTDAAGGAVHDAVAKLGPIPSMRDEARRFEAQISRLDPAATPRMLAVHEHGAKSDGGVFYQLAAHFDGTAFDATLWEEAVGDLLARSLEAMTARWSLNYPQTQKTVAEIRRRVLDDADKTVILTRHDDLPWVDAFEAGLAQTIWCCVHGDLHGENVLAAQDGRAVLIDYGDVEEGPRCLDPISLEFSLLFHPKSPFVNGPWPTADQACAWASLDDYLEGCPAPHFVRAVRAWTVRAAAGQREIAATAYAYLLRQLKYDTTDGVRAKLLLEGTRNLWRLT
jgi:CheY-like chemotaxis protein